MRASAALLGLLGATLVIAASSGGALSPNVKGVFVRSPHAMRCYPGEPCDEPPPATYLAFTHDGHATRARLAGDGTFAVRLTGGLYRVSVLPGHSSRVSPATLRVPRSGVIHPRLVERTTTSLPAPG